MIKIIAKQSMEHNKEGTLLQQETIDCIKNHPYITKKILKKGKRAGTNLKRAVNQFNDVVEEQEIDESIYYMIECERELEEAIHFSYEEIKSLLWEKK